MPAPDLQGRARYLLGLRGGPPIETIEAIQPVISLAAYGNQRLPQLEVGDLIPRRFHAEDAVSGVALEFGQVSIRATDASILLLVDTVVISGEAATSVYRVGIVPNTEALHTQAGVARIIDMRLPGASLVASPVDVGGDTAAAVPTRQGSLRVSVLLGETMVLHDHWLLTTARQGDGGGPGSLAPEALAVTNLNAAGSCIVSFAGWIFEWGPGAR